MLEYKTCRSCCKFIEKVEYKALRLNGVIFVRESTDVCGIMLGARRVYEPIDGGSVVPESNILDIERSCYIFNADGVCTHYKPKSVIKTKKTRISAKKLKNQRPRKLQF